MYKIYIIITKQNKQKQTSNRKTPPPQFKESMSYKLWKNRDQMWQLVTSITKKKAIVITLGSLDNNAKAEKAVT